MDEMGNLGAVESRSDSNQARDMIYDDRSTSWSGQFHSLPIQKRTKHVKAFLSNAVLPCPNYCPLESSAH